MNIFKHTKKESESNSVAVLCNPRPEYWSGQLFSSSGDLPNPGIKPRSPALQADSLSTELQGKPKETRVGSLSLLQGIFPTQELNWGLLHCRWIFYQLSNQGSPSKKKNRQRYYNKHCVHLSLKVVIFCQFYFIFIL